MRMGMRLSGFYSLVKLRHSPAVEAVDATVPTARITTIDLCFRPLHLCSLGL